MKFETFKKLEEVKSNDPGEIMRLLQQALAETREEITQLPQVLRRDPEAQEAQAVLRRLLNQYFSGPNAVISSNEKAKRPHLAIFAILAEHLILKATQADFQPEQNMRGAGFRISSRKFPLEMYYWKSASASEPWQITLKTWKNDSREGDPTVFVYNCDTNELQYGKNGDLTRG